MLWVNYCWKVKACRNLILESDNKLHLMVSLCDMFSLFIFCNIMHRWIAMITRGPRHESRVFCLKVSMVKSGKFGQSSKFGQRPCLFHILIIGIKNKLNKQWKSWWDGSLRAVSSGFPLFTNVCPNLAGVRSYLTLPIACWGKLHVLSSLLFSVEVFCCFSLKFPFYKNAFGNTIRTSNG